MSYPYLVSIRNNATGEVRSYEELDTYDSWTPQPPMDEPTGAFMWSEGNYACDCNRALFFAHTGGEDEPEHPCGEGAYSVRITRPQTGEELYADKDWDKENA